MPTLNRNRKAYRDYNIEEKYEAGIKLYGHEVKALKEGHGDLKGSYIRFIKDKIYLVGYNLPQYTKAGELFHYDPVRDREVLLHRKERDYLRGRVEKSGYTIIPLKFYTKGTLIKLEIGLAKGKRKHDRKQDLIKKQQELETRRIEKERYKR